MKTKETLPLIIVDDHDELERSLLKAILKLKGFRVIEAIDGRETLDLVTQHQPEKQFWTQFRSTSSSPLG